MIRTALESDIPRMVEMGMRFRNETSYAQYLAGNAEKQTELGKTLIAKDGLIVSERNGQLVGMLGFIIHYHFISGEKVAGEVFWWVEPEHRGDGLRLLREAEKRARAAGAKYMHMIAPTDQVATVYKRLGYEFVEATYQRSL